ELALELRDVGRQRGLRQAERRRRTAEARRVGDRDHALELPQGHDSPTLSRVSQSCIGRITPVGRKVAPMKTIGDQFPTFQLKAVVSIESGKEFTDITDRTHAGKWKVVFFWPKDFTFVCPTEIAGFAKLDREFADRDAQLLGASIDSEYVHLA